MNVGRMPSVVLEPQRLPRRQGPVSHARAVPPVAPRRATDATAPRMPGSVPAGSARAPMVPLGFAAQMMAYDLLLDLRPSPQPTRKLVARYRRADALVRAKPQAPGKLV